jgi:hypothetical protein
MTIKRQPWVKHAAICLFSWRFATRRAYVREPALAGRGFGKAKRRSSRKSWPAEFSRFCQQNWCVPCQKAGENRSKRFIRKI